MKTSIILIRAAFILALFSSCSKENTLPAVEPIPAGEFYFRALINGQQVAVANDVDGYRLEGNTGGAFSASNSDQLKTHGTILRKPATANSPETVFRMFFEKSVADDITAVAGGRLPFCVLDWNGMFHNRRGFVLDFSRSADWQQTWMAGSNFDTAAYYAEVMAVTPYKKGVFAQHVNLDYYKVTLRFRCKLLISTGEADVTDGEAAILVARQK